MPARSRYRLGLSALVALAFAFGATSVAYADDPRAEAKAHYQSGVKLYSGGDYQGAIREFTAAQAIAPADLNNYNLALCYDKLGDADNGIKFYRAYLDRVPNGDKRAEIDSSIARLQAAQRAADDRRSAPPPPPAPSAPITPAPAPPAPVAGSTGTPGGDPQLDRIQGVDIGSMRDQRMGGGPPPPAGSQNMSNGGPPPPRDINSVGVPGANPQGPPPAGVGTAPTAQVAPGTQADVKPADPVYKKWWFWAVVGVSAYVVYSIATESSHDTTSRAGRLDGSLHFGKTGRATQAPAGLTLFSW